MNKIKNLRRNKKGFTLVEVIVVLVILAILIAIAVPSVMKYIDDANDAKYLAQGRAAMIATQAELVADYADDKKFNSSVEGSSDLLNAVSDEIGFKVTKIYLDGTEFKPTDTEVANPNNIGEFKFEIDGKTVIIPVNGEATVE